MWRQRSSLPALGTQPLLGHHAVASRAREDYRLHVRRIDDEPEAVISKWSESLADRPTNDDRLRQADYSLRLLK